MQGFKDIFQAYGGDYDVTMGRFMGNEAMFLRFLDMLPSDDSLSRLEEALAKNDLAAAFDAAHTLKGVSANLGLTPLYNAACALVEPLRSAAPADYETLHRAVLREFDRAEALRVALKEVAP